MKLDNREVQFLLALLQDWVKAHGPKVDDKGDRSGGIVVDLINRLEDEDQVYE